MSNELLQKVKRILGQNEITSEEHAAIQSRMAYETHTLIMRGIRRMYDRSHPFQETLSNAVAPAGGTYDIQPAFDCSVRYDSILALLPVGITAASLTIGENVLPLLSVSVATTGVTQVLLSPIGLEAERSDPRKITLVGNGTGPYFIGLFGHAFERFDRA